MPFFVYRGGHAEFQSERVLWGVAFQVGVPTWVDEGALARKCRALGLEERQTLVVDIADVQPEPAKPVAQAEEPARRKRGRPRKVVSNGGNDPS